MANQYTKGDKARVLDDDKEGIPTLTARQQRLFFNVASGRFKDTISAALDAGYALNSAKTVCYVLVKQYAGLIETLRAEFEAPLVEQAREDARLARRILKKLALDSANDAVKRLACRDILELAGELKTVKADVEDLTPKDLRAEAQRVAKSMTQDQKPTVVN